MRAILYIFLSLLFHMAILAIPFPQIRTQFLDQTFSPNSLYVALTSTPLSPPKLPSPQKKRRKTVEKKRDSKLSGKSGSLTGAKPLGTLNPHYPFWSRRWGHQGVVTLSAEISPQGKVHNVTILKSSGFQELDQEAQRTLREAIFSPAVQNGLPVFNKQKFTFRFKLR